ncbi:MAG TPA: RNA methyltransferase [Stenomitos sp.]
MLTSVQNPLVKQIRKLHSAKYRKQLQRFLLEGTHLVQEAVMAGFPLETLCYTEDWQRKAPDLWQQLQGPPYGASLRCEVVSEAVMQAIATTVHPDGVVAIAQSRPETPVEIQRLGLILETIQDPGNIGTILRTAAAAGVDGIWLSAGSVDLENPKVLRASTGAWFRMPTLLCNNLIDQIRTYRKQGFQVIATTPKASLEYWSVDFNQPTLVLIGNEGAGLSPSLLAEADLQVSIPVAGVESLNAAIATAVVLYEAKRQHVQVQNRSQEMV